MNELKNEILPTYGEFMTLLTGELDSFKNQSRLDEINIKKITECLKVDIQARDYSLGAIGLVTDSVEQSLQFLNAIRAFGTHSASLSAIYSAYLYESGDSKGAEAILLEGMQYENSSLINLLGKVFSAGWPHSSFVAMRNELHPKVTLVMLENSEKICGSQE